MSVENVLTCFNASHKSSKLLVTKYTCVGRFCNNKKLQVINGGSKQLREANVKRGIV